MEVDDEPDASARAYNTDRIECDYIPGRTSSRSNERSSRALKSLVRIRSVTPLAGFVVHLEFTDGTAKEVDLEKYLRGPIFEPLRTDLTRFREVRVEPGAGTIS